MPTLKVVSNGSVTFNDDILGKVNVYKKGIYITTVTKEQTFDCFLEDEYTFVAISAHSSHPFLKFCSTENQTSCWTTNPTTIPILFDYMEIHAFFDVTIIKSKGTKPCYTIENLKLVKIICRRTGFTMSSYWFPPAYFPSLYVVTPDYYSSYLNFYADDPCWFYLQLTFEIPTPMCIYISASMIAPGESLPNRPLNQLQIFEHDNLNVWGPPTTSWINSSTWNYYYGYSEIPKKTWLGQDLKLNVNKKYLTIYTQTRKKYSGAYPGPYIVRIHKKFKGIFGTIKTPEEYPVYNATVIDNKETTSDPTNSAGQYMLPRTSIKNKYILPQENETNKIWGKKTINKTILNLTAKEISELKEINADKP